MEHTIQDIYVQNYLEVGTVTVVRVGHLGGYTQTNGIGLKISGSSDGGIKVIWYTI